jgi:hypothetical protein
MRGLVLALALAVFGLTAAQAAEAEKPSAAETIEVSNLAIPIVRNGRLENYLFATVGVELADGADWRKLRERAHIVRDSFIRAVHRADLAKPDDIFALNEAALNTLLTPEANAVLGAKSIKSLKIVQWTSLRARTLPRQSQSAP